MEQGAPTRCYRARPEVGRLGDVGNGDRKSRPRGGASISWTVVTCLAGGLRAPIAMSLDFSREAGDAVSYVSL